MGKHATNNKRSCNVMAQCSCSATDSYAVGQEIQLLSQLTLSSTAYMVHLKLVTGVQDIQQF